MITNRMLHTCLITMPDALDKTKNWSKQKILVPVDCALNASKCNNGFSTYMERATAVANAGSPSKFTQRPRFSVLTKGIMASGNKITLRLIIKQIKNEEQLIPLNSVLMAGVSLRAVTYNTYYG